jgi:hypothetical protein
MSPVAKLHVPLLSKHKPTLRHASVCGAVFNVSTSIIGAGIMSIPAMHKVFDAIPAFLLILVIALLGDVSMEFLMRFTHSGDTTTYAGVMKESFGLVEIGVDGLGESESMGFKVKEHVRLREKWKKKKKKKKKKKER